MRAFVSTLLLTFIAVGLACGDDDRRPGGDVGGRDVNSVDTNGDVSRDTNFDAACVSTDVMANLENAPVDIIWVVDNSNSMAPAINQVQRGLDDFAQRIAASGLDYRVIMLSQQGPSGDYSVCIPPPLAGPNCTNGERFFHVDVEIRSTQPVEQILGTLAQSDGYSEGESRGGPAWLELLRPNATKSFVVVTDDNSRTCEHPHNGGSCQGGGPQLTATSLEDFPGGANPLSNTQLGPGILTSRYGSLFEGYTFNGIYGWGDATDPSVTCGNEPGFPDSPGYTYTELVRRTGGVRAQICDQANSATWNSFFDDIATTVRNTSRLLCEIDIPQPPQGETVNPNEVNVVLNSGASETTFGRVDSMNDCVPGAWYYDNASNPTQVLLCPQSCQQANDAVRADSTTVINVQFGCQTRLI